MPGAGEECSGATDDERAVGGDGFAVEEISRGEFFAVVESEFDWWGVTASWVIELGDRPQWWAIGGGFGGVDDVGRFG